MSPETERLLAEVLKLPAPARAALAGSLIQSLDQDVDADAETAWAIEVARRAAALDSGAAQTITWSEVRRRVLNDSGRPNRP